MKILGVDPGRTTGLSLIIDGKVNSETNVSSLLALWEKLREIDPSVLVIEKFVGGGPASEHPHKAIGVCELYIENTKTKMVYSNPSILQGRKKPKGLSPHIWSARCHALHYCFGGWKGWRI